MAHAAEFQARGAEGEEKGRVWQRREEVDLGHWESALRIVLAVLPQRILGAGQPVSPPQGSVYQAWIFLPV